MMPIGSWASGRGNSGVEMIALLLHLSIFGCSENKPAPADHTPTDANADPDPTEAVATYSAFGIATGETISGVLCTAPLDIATGHTLAWIPGPIPFIAPRDI